MGDFVRAQSHRRLYPVRDVAWCCKQCSKVAGYRWVWLRDMVVVTGNRFLRGSRSDGWESEVGVCENVCSRSCMRK